MHKYGVRFVFWGIWVAFYFRLGHAPAPVRPSQQGLERVGPGNLDRRGRKMELAVAWS